MEMGEGGGYENVNVDLKNIVGGEKEDMRIGVKSEGREEHEGGDGYKNGFKFEYKTGG